MDFNKSKTVNFYFTRKIIIHLYIKFGINGPIIRTEHSNRHLKILIQSDGKWTTHLQEVCKKNPVCASLRIWRHCMG